jgi:hypothetical protein
LTGGSSCTSSMSSLSSAMGERLAFEAVRFNFFELRQRD